MNEYLVCLWAFYKIKPWWVVLIIEKICVSALIEAGTDPLPSPTTGQEARPEAVGAVGLDGVIAGSQEGEVIAG